MPNARKQAQKRRSNRTGVFQIRLSETERAKIQAWAAVHKLKASAYIRKAAMKELEAVNG